MAEEKSVVIKEVNPKSFKIKMPIVPAGHGVSVVIDGIELKDKIKAIRLQAEVGELTELTIVFGAGVDIEGEAVLSLLDHTGKPLVEEDTEDET